MTEAQVPFGARLSAAVAERGPLCAGVDPHPALLREWGLTADAGGLERFALTATEALAGEVSVLKPQSAFFEAYGSAGIAVLERVLLLAREAGALVLLDVKRGDIGSTMAAYAAAYLTEGAPLAADAITVSPYLGFDSLLPTLELAREQGRGVFVLARTSNPESARGQQARVADGADGAGGADSAGGRTLAQSIVDAAARRNATARRGGDVGVVVGATIGADELDLSALNGPVLAPGFGAQGATVADLRRVFGSRLTGVLPASARDILRHGPDPAALRAALRHVQDSLRG
ncbi:orotidine-5'-phosphate decarboxylase [Amycolatopsis palatopharyngis]|uniref:orotidine-5'-phosphate decarboxylase n=1 Tax=Amycolatopsis palatopharyngis TaxID=187982 RepID=UPI000E266328|nr:orotidine-5'-phosphate decarboxylase [Amycolatopsis palatopharyngis]